MNKINLNNLEEYIDKEITLVGFVDNVRNLQWVQFIVLRDINNKIQITIEKSEECNKEIVEIVNNLTNESTIKVAGKLVKNEKVKLRGMELIPSTIEVTSVSVPELPVNIKDKDAQDIDTRLDNRFLDLRNEFNTNIFRIQTEMIKSFRDYLYKNDFIEIHTPKLIAAASESGSDVFEVKYFDRLAYLAQSPQFYKQMAMSSGMERIFETGPVFRAENSNTSRHATEFTGFDLEFSYIDSYVDVMNLEEAMLIEMLKNVKDKYGDMIKEIYNQEVVVPTSFPRVKLNDLLEILESKYNLKVEDRFDLTTEAERLACQYAQDEFNCEFIFVTDYPKEKRAFYHMRDGDTALGYDLLWRGVEITTGAQREHRYDILVEQAKEKGLDKDVEFYLDFFKYGCPPHGGFGLGVDRLTMLLLGLPSLKESMLLFRGPNRLNP